MKKIITFSLPCVILYICLLGGSNVSCNKPSDCKVIVTVLDSGSNAPVVGATVKLYANINPPGQIQGVATTDGSGNANFDFQLPAIFDVQVTKAVTPKSPHNFTTLSGTGLVQLQVGGTVTSTITVDSM
jgi:hypothetical protein